MNKPKLSFPDYQQAAKLLNVSVPVIRAVTAVESGGTGFLPDGKCVIRFEPHIFCRRTNGQYNVTNPELSFTVRKIGYPVSTKQSWDLFEKAAKLNANAAVQSTSWGLFQIMGFHFGACGCDTLTEFVAKMEDSEGEQLKLFCEFILTMGLDDELRTMNWPSFARQYNGATYATNQYDVKLKRAFDRFAVG